VAPLQVGFTPHSEMDGGHLGLEGELGQVPVAHICNPSYSGGRDHEGCGSKPALGK
jgi:hypothetical protein